MLNLRRIHHHHVDEVYVSDVRSYGEVPHNKIEEVVSMAIESYMYQQHGSDMRMRGHRYHERPIIIINMFGDSSTVYRPDNSAKVVKETSESVATKQNLKLLL